MGENHLRVNGTDIGASGRGINVLEIDRVGNKIRTSNFDVYASPNTETDNLVSWIESVQGGHIILFSANDHAGNIQDNGVNTIESLGSEEIQSVQDGGRNNWAFICVKGLGPLSETFAPSGEGPVTTSHTIPKDMSLTQEGTLEGDVSEVGPAPESLVGWWPLDGHTNDYSGNGNNVSPSYGTPKIVSGLGQSAYYFNESSDGGNGASLYNDELNGIDSDNITMSAWINPNNSSDGRSPIFRGGGDVYFQHYSDDRIATYWYGWNDTGYHYSLSGSVPTNEWSHIVVTWNGTTGEVKFYVNGDLNNTVSGVGNGGGDPATSDVKIGRENSGRRFDGKIQDLRIYNDPLTASEIETLYKITDPRSDQQVMQSDDGVVYTKGGVDERL